MFKKTAAGRLCVWLGGLAILLASPGFGQDQRVQELLCKAPDFNFQWFSYQGANLVIKADPEVTLEQLAVYTTSTDPEKTGAKDLCPKEPDVHCFFELPGSTKVTKDGIQKNIPINKDIVKRIYRQNGWVRLTYKLAGCEPGELVKPVVERHSVSIDAGSVLSLEKDGKWSSQLEMAVAAKSKWFDWLTGFVDLRYSYIGAVDPPQDSNAAEDKAAAGDETQNQDDLNPFASGGGSLRGNFYLGWHPFGTPSFAVIGGTGFSTSPNQTSVRALPRTFAGIRFEVFAYNVTQDIDSLANTTGFIQIGAARDRLWVWDEAIPPAQDGGPTTLVHHDERDRWFIEAQFKFMDSPGRSVSLSPRIYADLPMSGEGPADVRISILAKVTLQRLNGALNRP